MTKEQWQQLQLLLDQAMELPESERPAFARSATAEDAELGAELLSLLEACARGPELPTPPTEWFGLLAESAPPRFAPGDVVAERYRIDRILGRGGMGEVYAAWDRELSIAVALKTLHLSGDSEDARRRLQIEGMLARAIWHPNVCRIYDLACHAEEGRETWFLTMEQLPGRTLANALAGARALPLERARHLAEQMAAGLAAAHRAGVVHRDFKPANVLLVERDGSEQAVVTDFGIARGHEPRELRREGDAGDEQQDSGRLFGTLAYMAPEQLRGEVAGPAADLYALGIVCFEMLTGALPFSVERAEESDIEAARRRLVEEAPSPRALRPDLDDRWESTVARCLERDPARRFARAEEVIDALTGLDAGRASTPHADPQSLSGLPPERDPFVGRETELAALEQALLSGARVVTLVGAAGMGKTRLALHYAWSHLDRWPGGIRVADLSDAHDADDFFVVIARALGVEIGRGDPTEQLARTIAVQGRCLILLDNAERVSASVASALGSWVLRAPEAHFLVTSRTRMGLGDAERVEQIEALTPEEGSALFAARARRLRPDIRELDPAMSRELVRRVDGMPLAIELAAARIRVMPLEQIVGQMRQRFSLLTGGASERHATLLATIGESWELLSVAERSVFAQCSVFEGGFTLDAAEAVVACDPPVGRVADLLRSLIDRSLLRTSISTDEARGGHVNLRFGMLASLQEYARIQLRQASSAPGTSQANAQSETSTLDRHCSFFVVAARGLGRTLDDGRAGGASWLALEPEFANLLVACRHAVARGNGATASAAYRGLWSFFSRSGPYGLAVELGRSILESLPLAPEDEAQVLTVLANCERFAGLTAEAIEHVESAVKRFASSGNREEELKARDTLVRLLTARGRRAEARTQADIALGLSRALGDRRMEGFLLSAIGELHRREGGTAEAKQCWNHALALARAIEDRRMEGILLNNLGTAHQQCGEVDAAEECFDAAVRLHRASHNRRSEGIALANLGQIERERGRLDAALELLNEALRLHEDLGDRRFVGALLTDLGRLQRERGDAVAARSRLDAALALHRELDDRAAEASTLEEIGLLHEQDQQAAEARACYESALEIHRACGDPRLEAQTLARLAALHLADGDPRSAHARLVEVESIAARTEAPHAAEVERLLQGMRSKIGTR